MIGAAAAFSVMAVLVKLAGQRLPAPQIVLVRVVLTLALSYLLIRRAGVTPWGHDRRRLVLRGALGFAALSLYYLAITRLALADATTIHQAAPVVTAVVAAVTLGERTGPSGWAALGLGLIGTVVVARPVGLWHGEVDGVGVLAAVGSAVCAGVVYATVRQLAQREHALVIVFYFPLVALPLALPWALPVWVAPTPLEWLVLLGVAVATQLGQVLLTMGLAREPAGRATAVGYLQVVFAAGWGLAFAEVPPWTSLLGAGLILAGVALASR
jgi:drug/metabolite transporter (DMT)-like permease